MRDLTTPRPIISVAETARLTGLRERAVRELGAQGVIPGMLRIGRVFRFKRAAVLRWLEDAAAPGARW